MQIHTRPADLEDLKDIWLWRNDPLTIKQSIEANEITFQDHSKWYKECISNDTSYIFISEDSKKNKLGMTRFDINNDNAYATVSINLNPGHRGLGLGKDILQFGINIFRKSYKLDLIARIKKSNGASIKCFEKCNFSIYDTNQDSFFFKNSL